jgi:hypothetical protein
MILALYVFIVFIGLLFAQEVFRRFPKLTLAIFIVLPIILILYLTENKIKLDWFNLVKVISMVFALFWFSMFRLTNLSKSKFAKLVIYLLLLINIFEAIAKDVLNGGVTHYFNAIAGILLIITLNEIDSINTIKDKYVDVNWSGMTLMWIIGYTVWNWTFVYLNFVNVAALHIAVLGAPLIIAFVNKGRWIQTRTLTLGAYLFSYFLLFPKFDSRVYDSVSWANESIAFFLAGMSLIFMIIYAIIFLRNCQWSNIKKIT